MPIKITEYTDTKTWVEVAWLCDDAWELPVQLRELETWLASAEATALPFGSYIADIGFSPRDQAAGDSAVLTRRSIETLAQKGIELHLSEYPSFVTGDDDKEKISVGEIYEDSQYHPCICTHISYEEDEIEGISLIDGSFPRSCSLTFSGVRRLSIERAWEIRQNWRHGHV